MIISSSNKTINTYPLLNLLREGENNADTVTIQLPLQYGDIDLSRLSYTIYGTTWIYAASAVDSNINGSKGIAITDNGFEVSQTSSTSPMDGLKMHLNAGSNYYGYLAIRK